MDANLFEQLVRRGRAELLSARPDAAAETFRDSLDLWRGNVLEGVPTGPVLYAHATRLEELRRSVVALRIEADLQLGRHHELVPDGQLYVDLVDADGRAVPVRQVLGGMLRALGAAAADVPANLGEATLQFRSWTADRWLLVVVNKAGDEHGPHHLFPTGPGVRSW